MNTHSIYSPSRLSRILACPGSVRLIASLGIEEKTSSYAEHGTMLHEIMDKRYKVIGHEGKFTGFNELSIDDQVLITDAEDYFYNLIKASPGQCITGSETNVSLVKWGLPEVYGILDRVIKVPRTLTVHIIDWKFGAGVEVSAENNTQLMAYAAGEIPPGTLYKNIVLHIVQPAIHNYSSWELSYEDLFTWVHTDLALGIQRAKRTQLELNPGAEQCRWCPAVTRCEATIAQAQNAAITVFETFVDFPSEPDPEAIVKLLSQAKSLEAIIKALTSRMKLDMLEGTPYPGYKLVAGRSNRKWIDVQAASEWLSKKCNFEDLYETSFVSVAKAEKLIKSFKKDQEFQALYEKVLGSPTVVPEDDKRPAIDANSNAENVFKYFQIPA